MTVTVTEKFGAQRKIWILEEKFGINCDLMWIIWNKLFFGRGSIWHREGYYITYLAGQQMFFVQLCLRPGMGQPSNVLGQPGNDYVDKVKDEGKYFFVFFSLFSGLPGPLGVLSITRPVLSRSDRVLDFHAA